MVPACCHLAAALADRVALHAVKPASAAAGSVWAADVPAWIGAVATVELLIGAIFTAIYAKRAFDGQTEELAGQRRINALQAKDLEASLEERERLRRI